MPKEVKDKAASASKPRAAKPKSDGTTKRASTKKDKDAPKRALSAYMFFAQNERPQIKEDNPEASFGELGKILGAKWKEMDENEKAPYQRMADDDKVRAADAKAEYESSGAAAAFAVASGKKPASKSKAKPASKKSKPVVEEDDEDDESDAEESDCTLFLVSSRLWLLGVVFERMVWDMLVSCLVADPLSISWSIVVV